MLVVTGWTAGCASGPPRIELTTYDAAGRPEQHYAHFSRTGYRATDGGFLEIAMETESPSSIDPEQIIRQIIYLRTFWYPQPGRTAVEATQVDAMMMYALLTPPTGIRCDGSAMMTYKWNREGKEIEVLVESGTLAPRYRMGDAVEPFGPSRFVGRALVFNDPGYVVRTRQFLETQFQERPLLGMTLPPSSALPPLLTGLPLSACCNAPLSPDAVLSVCGGRDTALTRDGAVVARAPLALR